MGGDFGMVRLQYDALGRRVSRTRTPIVATDPDKVTAYVNGSQASWQVLAEFDGVTEGANLVATYVYGNYIDEPIQMRRDFDGSGPATFQTFYYHQDDLFNVVALTAGGVNGVTIPGAAGSPFANGAIVERYRYGDYGLPSVRDAAGADLGIPPGSSGNPFLFTGREYDAFTGFYYYRTRYMEPTWGRFTTRDTIGTWGDPLNNGNALAIGASQPWQMLDPLGEKSCQSQLNSCLGRALDTYQRRQSEIIQQAKDDLADLLEEAERQYDALKKWLQEREEVCKSECDIQFGVRLARAVCRAGCVAALKTGSTLAWAAYKAATAALAAQIAAWRAGQLAGAGYAYQSDVNTCHAQRAMCEEGNSCK